MQGKIVSSERKAIFIECFGRGDPQFTGALKAFEELAAVPGFSVRSWEGGSLRLLAEGGVSSIVIAGHGSEESAGLGSRSGLRLAPADLVLSGCERLYLLGCYQGKDDLREKWARECGLEPGSVEGSEAETETLLSTLFILHCATEGVGSVGGIFQDWVLANRLVRPYFEPARRLYARTGGDPLAVLDFLHRIADLSPVADFLALARKRPEFLTGIVPFDGRI